MSNYLVHMQQVGQGTAFERRVSYLRHNFANYLLDIKASSQQILEIGPGVGELLSVLNDQNFTNIDIIDNDQAVLNYCKKKFKIKNAILAQSLNLTPYIKKRYDLIVLTQVFEHIPKTSYLNWMKNLYHALKPGGHILITVPNGANPLVGTERYGDLQHENVFTVFSFQELMTFADLKNYTYEIRGFEIPPNNPLNLIRLVLQKLLHSFFIALMMINGAIYQKLMTPNITLVISKKK